MDDIQDVLRETQKLLPEENPTSDLTKLRNIAITYRESGHILEAIDQFNTLLTINVDYLYAQAGLAQCYAKEIVDGPKPDWEKALYNQDIVIKHIQEGIQKHSSWNDKEDLKGFLMDKAIWLRKLERYDNARTLYLKLLEEDTEDDVVRLQYLFTLCETQNYSAVVEALDDLDRVDEKTQKNRLTRLFHVNADNDDYHSKISHAFKQVNGILTIQKYYQAAVDEAGKDAKRGFEMKLAEITLAYHLAAVLWNHGDGSNEKQEAIRLWEQLTDRVKTEGVTFYAQVLAARRLARIYISQAVEAGRDTPVASEMLEKVQTFASAPKGESNEDDDSWGVGLSPAQARSLRGRYYSRVGDTEQARALLRSDVDVGLKLLSDDDAENDYQGFRKLGDAFMDYGDDKNAIAAWSLIQPTRGLKQFRTLSMPLDTRNSPSPTNETNGDVEHKESTTAVSAARKRFLDGPLGYSCDGRCGRTWSYADDIYVCRECIDTQFDAPCLDKLRRGAIARDICDKNHNFLHVPPWDCESADRAESGKVLVGDEIMNVDDWLESIKVEWGLVEAKAEGEVAVVSNGV